jgi:hypothetical protein
MSIKRSTGFIGTPNILTFGERKESSINRAIVKPIIKTGVFFKLYCNTQNPHLLDFIVNIKVRFDSILRFEIKAEYEKIIYAIKIKEATKII